jgi:hypothetical protein
MRRLLILAALLLACGADVDEPEPRDPCSDDILVLGDRDEDEVKEIIDSACYAYERAAGVPPEATSWAISGVWFRMVGPNRSHIMCGQDLSCTTSRIAEIADVEDWRNHLRHEVGHILLLRLEPYVPMDNETHHARMRELGLCAGYCGGGM